MGKDGRVLGLIRLVEHGSGQWLSTVAIGVVFSWVGVVPSGTAALCVGGI
jgi:hypothetical protein